MDGDAKAMVLHSRIQLSGQAATISSAHAHRPLGQVLVESGAISAADKLRTLERQSNVEASMGDILVAHGLIDRHSLFQAIAAQYDTTVADFSRTPPDVRLVQRWSLTKCLRHCTVPWQQRNGMTLVATAKPKSFEALRPELEARFGPVQMVITSEAALFDAILANHPVELASRAETRVKASESCRTWRPSRGLWLVLGLVAAAGFFAPKVFLIAVVLWAVFILAAQTLFTALAWFKTRNTPPAGPSTLPMRWPSMSILVPLYKEREIAGRLIKRLNQIDYPIELLDICLIVEADDNTTIHALDQIYLPAHIRQIVVPHGTLKTKPRALNYALDFCRGSIIGVYDAEDAPAPDQLRRVAERFYHSPPEVACLQGVLDYYNAKTNWLSRCFTIEYATWFRVILPGMIRMGLTIPLGGTTLFLRRDVLDKLGGWDSHNVTEDADLGIRLARYGYRTELVESVTMEEANCRVWPWIKQRSRWLKGYALTWAVHNRSPLKLYRDLGPWRFFGVQLLLLGTLTQFALTPLFWSFWLITLGLGHPLLGLFPTAALWSIAGLFLMAEAVSIAVRLHAVRRTNHQKLTAWVPSLYFYFPLAALAVYKALAELVLRPFFWDKTAHGVFDDAKPEDAPDITSAPHPVSDESQMPSKYGL